MLWVGITLVMKCVHLAVKKIKLAVERRNWLQRKVKLAVVMK